MQHIISYLLLLIFLNQCSPGTEKTKTIASNKPIERWSEAKANQWYGQHTIFFAMI